MWAKAHVTRGFTNPRLKPGVIEFLLLPGFSPSPKYLILR